MKPESPSLIVDQAMIDIVNIVVTRKQQLDTLIAENEMNNLKRMGMLDLAIKQADAQAAMEAMRAKRSLDRMNAHFVVDRG